MKLEQVPYWKLWIAWRGIQLLKLWKQKVIRRLKLARVHAAEDAVCLAFHRLQKRLTRNRRKEL